uniref:Uncharacterized protein n=1 Tax=Anopheles darlingi TaxID=43151 RepID=A0A2M4D680_ANODA
MGVLHVTSQKLGLLNLLTTTLGSVEARFGIRSNRAIGAGCARGIKVLVIRICTVTPFTCTVTVFLGQFCKFVVFLFFELCVEVFLFATSFIPFR